MVKYSSRRLDRTFAALSDPTRRSMLSRLRQGEATVGELAEPFRISLPAISKHLGILERAGLVERKREGRTQRCRLRGAPLGEAFSWLDHYRDFWEGNARSPWRLPGCASRSSEKINKQGVNPACQK